MPHVELQIVPDTAHVRVVRLVAVSLARMNGLDEDAVEDVRLAVGEACGRAVAAHLRHGVEASVSLHLDGRDPGADSGSGNAEEPALVVSVQDRIPLPAAEGEDALRLVAFGPDGSSWTADGDASPAVVGLLQGLADGLTVRTGEAGTMIELSWLAGAR